MVLLRTRCPRCRLAQSPELLKSGKLPTNRNRISVSDIRPIPDVMYCVHTLLSHDRELLTYTLKLTIEGREERNLPRKGLSVFTNLKYFSDKYC